MRLLKLNSEKQNRLLVFETQFTKCQRNERNFFANFFFLEILIQKAFIANELTTDKKKVLIIHVLVSKLKLWTQFNKS